MASMLAVVGMLLVAASYFTIGAHAGDCYGGNHCGKCSLSATCISGCSCRACRAGYYCPCGGSRDTGVFCHSGPITTGNEKKCPSGTTSSSGSTTCVQECARGCKHSWRGDNTCDSACNHASCNYDNGDCSPPQCTQTYGRCTGDSSCTCSSYSKKQHNSKSGGVCYSCSRDCRGYWGSWGSCSRACGGGWQYKTYHITTQKGGAGEPCSSRGRQSRQCNTQSCSRDCIGSWGSWSACDQSCGGGHQTQRYTVTTSRQGSGSSCSHADGYMDRRSCNTQSCPRDCIGSWGSWSACDQSCGGGQQTQRYTVTTSRQGSGRSCSHADGYRDRRACNTQPCSRDCIGSWGSWGTCSLKCGGGQQTQRYTVTTSRQGSGSSCLHSDGAVRKRSCNPQPCIFDCAGVLNGQAKNDRCGKCNGDGSSCGGCSLGELAVYAMKTPKIGSKFQDFLALQRRALAVTSAQCVKCLNAQSVVIKGVRVTFDGTIASSAQRAVGNHVSCYCAEKTDLFSTDPMNPCFGKPACPQNFVVTCASNEVLKGQYAADVNQYFEKMFQPCLMANGGSAVAAKRTCHEDDRLGTQVCAWYSDQPPGLQCQPKLATLSLWAGLRRCYMAVRSDECVSPDRRRWLCGTGLQSTVKLKCPQQFPGCTIRATTEYTTDASMQMIAHTGYECSWNESSAAAKTVLAKISSAAFASKNTGYFRVDCVGKWSTFGSCSKTCGGGLKSQTFHVTTAAAHGGKSCKYSDGQAGRDVRCNMQPCPVHCVGAWGLTKCSRKCGGGIRHRMFQVVTPASGGGRPCINATGAIDTSNVQMCNTHPCPVDCVGKWSTFGSCSKTCGGGVKSQTFHVTTAAAHGGKSCQYSDGQAGRDVRCNMQPCPVHCVGAWGLTKCSRKCGGGIRHRMFQVVTPASGGGRPCSHASGDTDKPSPCNTHPCPVNCVGAWGDYGDCSTTCGGGTQEKVYTVSITAAHGGADCVAADDETHERSCGNDACSATPEIEESSSVVLAAGLAAVFALCAGLIIRSKCVHSQQVGSAFDKTDGIENPVSRDADFDSRHAEFSESHITDVVTMELRGCSVTLLKDNVIGEGANGIVIAAVLTRQGGKQENVAAKSLPSGATDRDREKFQKEFEILAQAAKACRGACRVYGLLKRDNAMYIIMKRYPQSLLDLLEKERIDDTKRAPLSFNTYMQIGIGVAHALTELHAIDIRVMDLKPANVLLDQDSVPVISDFGIAAVCGETLTHGTTAAAGATAGTPQYKAPEQWNTKLGKVGTKCDIWAWGCIMVEMLSGIEPWQDHDTIQILSAIVVDKESPKIPKGVPPPLNKLLQQCFQFDCEDRPSATGLVNLLERLLAAMVKTDSSQLGLLADAMLRSSWAKREVYEYSRLISADECSDPKLVARYEEYKAKLESEGANPQDIEKLLFHGCAENAVTNISRQGLRKERQRSASGSQWQRFGAAFYFGVQSSKSHEYPLEDMRNLPPGTHTRSMLLCKVATGKVYETKENKPDLEAAPPGYHSVYGFADASGPLNYDEVVVYDEAAIQPYVVVHYEFVKHPPVPLSSIASSDEESEPEFLLDVINDIVLEEDEEDPDLE